MSDTETPRPRANLERRLGEIKASIAARSAELRDRAERLRQIADVRGRVRAHPWMGITVGLTAGFLVGRSLRRRRSIQATGAPPSLLGALITSLALTVARNVAERFIEDVLRPRSHTVAEIPDGLPQLD